jgi:hypothetical protein
MSGKHMLQAGASRPLVDIPKRTFCFYIVVFLFLLIYPTFAMAITIDELADICKAMESSIVDVSIEYEWYRDTPLTVEEQLKVAAEKGFLLDVGRATYKLSAARSAAGRDPNSPVFDRYYLEVSTTFMDKDENIWDGVTKISYDGKVTKHLSIGGFPESVTDGTIASGKEFKDYMHPINLTPIGFSIFRQGIRDPDDKLLLADILRNKKEFVRLDNTITKVNGFNAICASLLTENDPNTQIVYCRIYFSVDHGYTPVRYEFTSGKRIAFAFDVQSLEQIAKGLWFPSSGVVSCPDEQDKNVYQATGKIVVNQGLTDKQLNIEFPVGTKVYDRINDRQYVVKSTGE